MASGKGRKRGKAAAFEPIESRCFEAGYQAVAGLDEAGRGCLAGPVVAAAVILPLGVEIPGLNDSKKLTAAARESLYPIIHEVALGVAVGVGSLRDIETLNILHASLLAMVRAAEDLPMAPDYLLIDGNHPIPMDCPQETVVKGDSRSISIAAASIIAKVYRDRLMMDLDKLAPGYGFDGHKGYGTAAHREAIARLGPSPYHRLTFKGVREYVHLPLSEPEVPPRPASDPSTALPQSRDVVAPGPPDPGRGSLAGEPLGQTLGEVPQGGLPSEVVSEGASEVERPTLGEGARAGKGRRATSSPDATADQDPQGSLFPGLDLG